MPEILDGQLGLLHGRSRVTNGFLSIFSPPHLRQVINRVPENAMVTLMLMAEQLHMEL